MMIVAVTACPTGIAHTYMAAERLEKAGKKLGIPVRVETQGAMGIENELSADEIRQAAAVVFAVGITVQKQERFEGKRIYEVPVQDAIKNPESILLKIKDEIGR
jgi:fructose-specific phosphotransferase system IIB component